MRPWHFGNTTVRSPLRLRELLLALSTSSLLGNLRGRDQEIALRNLLGEKGIVELGNDKTNSVGRKWRSALGKLGFLYSALPKGSGLRQTDLGAIDTITKNGWRLISAESVPAMQECFLRSLAAYYIPSVLEKKYAFQTFSPLRHTLSIMINLEKSMGESCLSFAEMALIVQLTNSEDNIKDIVTRILDYRIRRDQSSNKRRFDSDERTKIAGQCSYIESTFNDYADANFRHLKATGLVQSKGKGISLVAEKRLLIEKLIANVQVPASDMEYLSALCNGARLPTDDKSSALAVLKDLSNQLLKRNIPFEFKDRAVETAADIALVRHDIEDLLMRRNEEEYADCQVNEWKEIASYMELIIEKKNKRSLSDGKDIHLPKTERPAYFEWILWRAFLAIDSLKNKPYEARRFKIDQDFLPIGTAPGNGPDLIFEFEDFVIVCEVTLTDNSRQEAAEGEPVRRHVADVAIHYATALKKRVYGLFIACRIDPNTLETFRVGTWYVNGVWMKLDILPITLEQFKSIFEALFRSNNIKVSLLQELLCKCLEARKERDALTWREGIAGLVSEWTTKFN